MSSSSKGKKYSKADIDIAISEITNKVSTVYGASKKYGIPLSTLRNRIAGPMKEKLCGNYSEANVIEALSDIKNGMSIYAAALNYKIPETTLRNRKKGIHKKNHGSKKVLSVEDESRLADWVILCAKSGYPKTKTQIRQTAAQIAKLSATKLFLKGLPTNGWFKSFSDRYPEVRKRTPESIGTASAAVTVEGLQNFFGHVEKQFKEADRLHLLTKPECWWNIDETGFELNPKPRIVYAKKGSKTVHIIEKGKAKEQVTCTYAVCGDGNFIPPLVTLKESFANLDVAAYVSKGKISKIPNYVD